MPKFSANLGFLWTELSLVDAIYAAKKAGFDAVECHWPFNTPSVEVNKALKQTGLPMLALNTAVGDVSLGEFGLCAFPDRIDEAQKTIEQAIDYAIEIDAKNVHVMSGKAFGIKGAKEALIRNLNFACELAKPHDITILIEPINQRDVPDYFLSNFPLALDILNSCHSDNLKIMFDCYHACVTHCSTNKELHHLLEQNLDVIGHIQFASIPNRHEPDEGDIDYADLFKQLEKHAYQGYLGAEYKPRTTTEAGLVWLNSLR